MTNTADRTTHRASFKPAVARSAVSWELDQTILRREGSTVLDLHDVTSGSYHSTFSHKTGHGKLLMLKTDAGEQAKLHFGSLGPNDGMMQYVKMVILIVMTLSQVAPNARIHIGGGRGMVNLMFGAGVMFALMGVAVMGFSGGASEPTGTYLMIGFGLCLVGFGSWLAINMYPWDQDRFRISAAQMAAAIASKQFKL